MSLTLREIVDGVLAISDRDDDGSFHQFVYKNLDVRRIQQEPVGNAHLANPLNDQAGGFSAREIPLDGSETINGDFLTLHTGTHDDAVYLLSHASLPDLEDVILGDGGVFNPFVDWIHAIVRGQVCKYEATFAMDGQRVVFEKDAQFKCAYGNKGGSDLRPFVDRKIAWHSDPENGNTIENHGDGTL